MYVVFHLHMSVHHVPGTQGGQKMKPDPLELEVQVSVSHQWVLGI